jgi:hypothetical protein
VHVVRNVAGCGVDDHKLNKLLAGERLRVACRLYDKLCMTCFMTGEAGRDNTERSSSITLITL